MLHKGSTQQTTEVARMRKLVVTENTTLDGVIDASEGWFANA
jgi:hypothetical protein